MGILRWSHKIWDFFWRFLLLALTTLVLLSVLLFGVLQLKSTKNYIAGKAEEIFSQQFEGVLSIGTLDGIIPYEFRMSAVRIYPDSSSIEAMLQADSLILGIEPFQLLNDRLVFNRFDITNPVVDFNEDPDGKSLLTAFNSRNPTADNGTTASETEIAFFIPNIRVRNGEIDLGRHNVTDKTLVLPDEIKIRKLDADLFVDMSREQRFLDIERLGFELEEGEIDQFRLSGQIFSDENFLEFNAFRLVAGASFLDFDFEMGGVVFGSSGFRELLKTADLRMNLSDSYLDLNELDRMYSGDLPLDNLRLNIRGEGKLDSFEFERLSLISNEHLLVLNGKLDNGSNPPDIRYDFHLEQAFINGYDLPLLELTDVQQDAIRDLSYSGYLNGDADSLSLNMNLQSDRGSLKLDGIIALQQDQGYELQLEMDSLNIGELLTASVEETSFNGKLNIRSDALNLLAGNGNVDLMLDDTRVNEFSFDVIRIRSTLDSGRMNPLFFVSSEEAFANLNAEINLTGESNTYTLDGEVKELDITDFASINGLDYTNTDFNIDLEAQGNSLAELFGKLSIDVESSVVNGDSLDIHQLYIDLNSPEEARVLRLTSTPMDLVLSGDINPERIRSVGMHWLDYFVKRYEDEIIFAADHEVRPDSLIAQNTGRLELSYDLQAKDLSILNRYIPTLPEITSTAQLIGNINADSRNLLFNLSLVDVFNTFDEVLVDSLTAQITGNFRYNSRIRDFSGLEINSGIKNIEIGDYQLQGVRIASRLQNDSLYFYQKIDTLGEDARFELLADLSLKDTEHALTIRDILLGNKNYQWLNLSQPVIRYTNQKELIIDEFLAVNDEQLLRLNGVISQDVRDSMQYNIQNIDLSDLSELINGRIAFAGILNGEFSTRSLTQSPSIQGKLEIEKLSFSDNIVGDITINSAFNADLNRFDTQISILTDSTKYPDYFIRNNRSGQNIRIDGYINAPDLETQTVPDSLYYFDLAFNEIDMWIFPFIAPKVFTEMEGRVTGSGYFRGNLEDYDFEVEYSADESIYIQPRFLQTYYYALGNLVFSSARGLEFSDFFIIDPSGGMATLNGRYDFNNFSQNHDIDLRLEMDEFHFLNNSFSIDSPFYGDAFGTGTVVMTGTSFNPVLATEGPVVLTQGTSIGVQLLEETTVEQNRKFIRRVKSFDQTNEQTPENGTVLPGNEVIDPRELSFNERFTLDMSFESSQAIGVNLIFDPVTGDQISSRGNLRMQISLEDQALRMFGRYDIQSGNYNFVSGEIFSRRLSLEPGGSIVFEGPPDDARLNLTAVYNSRPDVRSLSCTNQDRINDPNELPQRRPVELALNIGGTLSAIENNFRFRLPNALDNIQDNTLQTQLNALNSTEDEKLLQATSLLLTGRFVPICSSQDQNNTIASGLSGSSVVLNPFLSSQVISPLLSSQINSLLKSDVSSLDIDFNLNEFNQVDLGVALRLYNDRLVFRREGQLTGQQSNIGDLGATYRINQTISVTAFHRQDPSFNSGLSSTTQQVQDINGVGIEAQIEFDSGNEFFSKIGRFFGRLFGIKKSKKKNADDSQITASKNNP